MNTNRFIRVCCVLFYLSSYPCVYPCVHLFVFLCDEFLDVGLIETTQFNVEFYRPIFNNNYLKICVISHKGDRRDFSRGLNFSRGNCRFCIHEHRNRENFQNPGGIAPLTPPGAHDFTRLGYLWYDHRIRRVLNLSIGFLFSKESV